MMIGAILDTATPLRKRIESALRPNYPLAAGKLSKPVPARSAFGSADHGNGVLALSAWAATALSSAICFIVAIIALGMFDPDAERNVVQFVDSHRLLATALVFGPQLILVLAILAYDSRSRMLEKLLSETQNRMQTEIDRQRQSIIHLSRVGTVGQLSGALAHELSQPLTAIMNNAHAIDRMLSQKPLNLREVRGAISDIIDDDSRVRDVIHHLRALLRKDTAEFGRVDMTLLIHKVLGLVRKEMALHRVKPVVAIAPNFPLVWGDDVQLQQLLLNLIMNAIDAIESSGKKGGSLSITAYSVDGPGGGSYHLCISDTGSGFQPEIIEKLFEPFFSTKKQGLGLGLSISEAIVRGHNGSIQAENNNEGGATFHITLPAAHEKSA